MENSMMPQGKMTSLEIAELSGKPHDDLLKAIRKMEVSWIKLGQGNFSESYYINKQNRKMPMYELSKTESLYIATKFNDEARAKLIIRWESLEAGKYNLSVPSYQIFDPAERAIAWATEYKEKQKLQLVISEQAPKALAFERVIDNKTTYTLATLADITGIGRTTIAKELRKLGWMKEQHPSGTESTQYAKDRGYAKTIFGTAPNGKKTKQFVLFRKGVNRFIEKHLNHNEIKLIA